MVQKNNGFALAYVLVVALVIAIIASGLLSMVLMRLNATQRLANGVSGKAGDQAALAYVLSAWQSNGTVNYCAPINGVSCTGSPGVCKCSCKVGHETITAQIVLGQCQVQISCDPNAAGGCP